jgi:hypothetical protein
MDARRTFIKTSPCSHHWIIEMRIFRSNNPIFNDSLAGFSRCIQPTGSVRLGTTIQNEVASDDTEDDG